MFRSGLVDTLVTHANKEGFGLTPLSGDRHGYMPPLLKTKQNYTIQNVSQNFRKCISYVVAYDVQRIRKVKALDMGNNCFTHTKHWF